MPEFGHDFSRPNLPRGLPLRTVVLRHDLAEGGGHWDWMIQRYARPDSPLISFRVGVRVDRAGSAPFVAEPVPDHRAAYLELEGSLSKNRGSVRRVASGVAAITEVAGDMLEIIADFGDGAVTFRAARSPDGRLCFVRE